jgi:predicted PurR-regulated permease PerM
MNNQKMQFYFLLALLILTCVIAFFIFRPFIYILVFASVFAVIFRGVYEKIMVVTHRKAGFSAAITTIIIIFCILIPLSLIAIQIFTEISQLYTSLSAGNEQSGMIQILKIFLLKIEGLAPTSLGLSFNPDQLIKQVANWLMNNIGSIFSNMANMFTGLFIFIVGLFYLLKDGHQLKTSIIKFSPLSDKDDKTIFDKLQLAINSVVKGSILVALIQGGVATIGFTIFGVPNPFLWGCMAVISALIPAIGTSLVMIPSIIYLILVNHVWQGIGLIIWAILAVGLIDNFIGPKIVSRGIKMHPFITFLSTLGGLAYFGLAGFLLGPLIVNILFTLFGIYFSFVDKVSES